MMNAESRLKRLEAELPDEALLGEIADRILTYDASLRRRDVLASLRAGPTIASGERLYRQAGKVLFIREYVDGDAARGIVRAATPQ